MKIAIIGAGNMGGAIAQGLIESGTIAPSSLTIITPRDRTFADTGVELHRSISGNLTGVGMVIVAVKPWVAAEEIEQLRAEIGSRHVSICSVVAGLSLDELENAFSGRPLFQIMPNTAVRVSEGMTFIAALNASDEELEVVVKIFKTLGQVMTIAPSQMGGCMALASCGIAFALRYVRAAVEGGVELGIRPADAQAIVAQTMRGAAALLANGSHPEVEIDRVTTPGGITIKGLNAMEAHGFTTAVIEGLKASK